MHFCGMTWGRGLISRTRSSGGTTAAHATAKHMTKVAPCQLRLVCFQPCVHDESNSVSMRPDSTDPRSVSNCQRNRALARWALFSQLCVGSFPQSFNTLCGRPCEHLHGEIATWPGLHGE